MKNQKTKYCAKVREPSHEGSDPQEEGTLLEREDVESLQERQIADKELGRLVSLRLTQNEVCRLYGITKLRTTPYKPSTNQVERFHRTMNAILAKTIDDHHRDWDSQLPFAMVAYRETRREGTGYSPNFLVLGREVHMPLDLMYGTPDEGYEDYDAFVEDKRERMVDA